MIFFFNDAATTEIYSLSLHDALPIYEPQCGIGAERAGGEGALPDLPRSEEHTSELQSLRHLVCRLLLEKKHLQLHSSVKGKPRHSEHFSPGQLDRHRAVKYGGEAQRAVQSSGTLRVPPIFFF